MVRVCFFLFLTLLFEVKTKEEYVPALVWTSREFQGRKNVDYLVLKKIKSDLFESYIMELLGGKRPVVMVYLEHVLGTDDFEWRGVNGTNSFPFLSNQTVHSRLDYFRSVESPQQTITQLYNKGFREKHLKFDEEFDINEGELLILEFPAISFRRPEILRNHDREIEEMQRRLVDSGKPWVSIYTARHTSNRGYFLDLKQLSPWFVEEQLQERPTKALSLYRDEFTGFSLITKGSLQLYLPSPKNLALKFLENYLGASARLSEGDSVDFVIWFSNYTLTLYVNRTKEAWAIDGAKLLNGNGDYLKLNPTQKTEPSKNKCFFHVTEFQSEGKPVVKVTLSKYKFMRVEAVEEPCKKPYGFQLMISVIFFSIISAAVCWNKMLEAWDFSTRSKVIRIPPQSLLSFRKPTNHL